MPSVQATSVNMRVHLCQGIQRSKDESSDGSFKQSLTEGSFNLRKSVCSKFEYRIKIISGMIISYPPFGWIITTQVLIKPTASSSKLSTEKCKFFQLILSNEHQHNLYLVKIDREKQRRSK